MTADWKTHIGEDALAKIHAFIASNPQYVLDGVEQPGQGNTNRVAFARCGKDLVVFKIFCEKERKQRECFAMRYWRATHLVPELICDVGTPMIVMSHIPGMYLSQSRQIDDATTWLHACFETGRAFGMLATMPLSTDGKAHFESQYYRDHPTLEAYLSRILELGGSIHRKDPDFRDGFWGESLDFIESALGDILSQPPVLYHQDASNFHVQDGRFRGFFDLEMCRVGCAAMQMGSAQCSFRDDAAGWAPFKEGWEAGTGRKLDHAELDAAAAAGHLLQWREICRYLSYDGTPGSGFSWANPADPARYRKAMESIDQMLRHG